MENKSKERWHGAHHYSNKVHFTLIFVLFLIAAGIFWAYLTLHDKRFSYENIAIPKIKVTPAPPPNSNGVACTQEALMCPDGSFVGRTGPNCEFSPCPGE